MTREEAITWCDRFNDAWANADPEDDFPDLKYSDTLDQLFYLAGQALRQQETVTNRNGLKVVEIDQVKPLTLDELREMDNQPVWLEFPNDGDGRWDLIAFCNSEFLSTYRSGYLLLEEYGKTWLAYRRKPEEGTV